MTTFQFDVPKVSFINDAQINFEPTSFNIITTIYFNGVEDVIEFDILL